MRTDENGDIGDVVFVPSGDDRLTVPVAPVSSGDVEARLRYDRHNFGRQAELLSEELANVDFENLRPDNTLTVKVENGEVFEFVVTQITTPEAVGSPMLTGVYYPSAEQVHAMGIPQAIQRAGIVGSSPGGRETAAMGKMVQGLSALVYLPLSELGYVLDEEDRNLDLILRTAPVSAIVVGSAASLPATSSESVDTIMPDHVETGTTKVSILEIENWPGQEIGVTRQNIWNRLYAAPGVYGLRGIYWVNPSTGALTIRGKSISDAPTVWDAVSIYATDFTRNGDREAANSAAAFAYWALAIGLNPPDSVAEDLKGAGFLK